jgi:hypothetical protein
MIAIVSATAIAAARKLKKLKKLWKRLLKKLPPKKLPRLKNPILKLNEFCAPRYLSDTGGFFF